MVKWTVKMQYTPFQNTTLYGFERAPEDVPRFQLAPMGYRGYIESIPVREIKKN